MEIQNLNLSDKSLRILFRLKTLAKWSDIATSEYIKQAVEDALDSLEDDLLNIRIDSIRTHKDA